MKEKNKTLSPVIIHLKKLLKPCKDWQRISAWKESLLELKRNTGISPDTVRAWFSLKNPPSFDHVQKIADYKKIYVYDIYVNEKRWVKIFHVSPERQEIMKKLAEMPDDKFFSTVNINVLKNSTEKETEEKMETETEKNGENSQGEGGEPSP